MFSVAVIKYLRLCSMFIKRFMCLTRVWILKAHDWIDGSISFISHEDLSSCDKNGALSEFV